MDYPPQHKPPKFALARGVFALTLVFLWLVVCFTPFFFFSLFKILVPWRPFQHVVTDILLGLTYCWTWGVNTGVRWAMKMEYDFQGFENLDKRGRYFIFANHIAWWDIVMLFDIYHGTIPFPRWFLKRQLIWVPMIGYVCWAVDMPFMHRITPEQIEKNPKLKGKDLEVTRRSCSKFIDRPVTIANYLEGTRFTMEKHRQSGSQYRNLLPPKMGGTGFVLNAMGEMLDGIIDMTLVYSPGAEPKFSNFIAGKVRKVVVRARMLDVPLDIARSDLREDEQARQAFREWIEGIWREKDDEIDRLKAELEQEFGMKYEIYP